MQNAAYQKYRQNSIQTASPASLLIMLYDGAIQFTRQGIEGIVTKDYHKANLYLCKAQAVVYELIASLNHDYPVAENLTRIYEYMIHRLMQANVEKNAQYAEEIAKHLTELRDTWKQAAKLAAASNSSPSPVGQRV